MAKLSEVLENFHMVSTYQEPFYVKGEYAEPSALRIGIPLQLAFYYRNL